MTLAPDTLLLAEAVKLDGDAPALDLAVKTGGVTVITGPANDKSAWLELLAALRLPAAGRLDVLGQRVTSHAMPALRARVGYVSNQLPLLSNLNARLNVMLPGLYHHRGSQADAETRADELLDAFDYRGSRDCLPAHLDRLETIQVQLARALVLDPAIVFLDEPFELAWATSWKTVSERIGAIVNTGDRALLVATHNLNFAAAWADQVVFLADERVTVFDGWTSFSTSSDPLVAEFLQALPMKPEARSP